MDTPPSHSKKSAGITLVGILVATFILAAGAIAISRLSGSAEKFTGVGREVTVASSLAREGLELTRAVRDTNWFSSKTGTDAWLNHGLCVNQSGDIADSNHNIIIDPEILKNVYDGIKKDRPIDLADGDEQIYVNAQGAFGHEGINKTPYTRVISLDCSTKNDEPKFITITSTVKWSSRGADREVVLKERLYNWLPTRIKINPTPTPLP